MKKTIIIFILTSWISTGNILAEELDKIDIHGFISQGYLKSSDNNFLAKTKDGTFQFNETGINFGTWVTSDLHMGVQFFARDIGEIGNDEVDVDWAYADYHYQKWLGVRVGKIKSPMGLYNETRDLDMLRANILLPQGTYNEGWRDSVKAIKGLSIYGILSAGLMGRISYEGQVGAMDLPTEGGIAKFINTQAAVTTNSFDDIETNYVASIRWQTPIEGMRIGATGRWFDFSANLTTNNTKRWRDASLDAFLSALEMTAEEFETAFGFTPTYDTIAWATVAIDPQLAATDVVGNSIDLSVDNIYYMLSIEYIWEDLTIAAEFGENKFEYEMLMGTSVVEDGEVKVEAWYGSAAYRFNWWFEAGIYYSYFCPDTNDRDGDGMNSAFGYPKAVQYSKDWCLSLHFNINEHWSLKLEGHYVDGLAVMYMEDQELKADGSYDVDDKWSLFAIKTTFSF